jgi:RNase H-like domain found in reverse transcriptase
MICHDKLKHTNSTDDLTNRTKKLEVLVELIRFFSQVLKQNERNYSTIDKELMGIVTGIGKYNPFLRSKKNPVNVLTDNRHITLWSKFTL